MLGGLPPAAVLCHGCIKSGLWRERKAWTEEQHDAHAIVKPVPNKMLLLRTRRCRPRPLWANKTVNGTANQTAVFSYVPSQSSIQEGHCSWLGGSQRSLVEYNTAGRRSLIMDVFTENEQVTWSAVPIAVTMEAQCRETEWTQLPGQAHKLSTPPAEKKPKYQIKHISQYLQVPLVTNQCFIRFQIQINTRDGWLCLGRMHTNNQSLGFGKSLPCYNLEPVLADLSRFKNSHASSINIQ